MYMCIFVYLYQTSKNIFIYHFVALGSLLHVADIDIDIGEYVIPKGAIVVAITRGMMYDPKVKLLSS